MHLVYISFCHHIYLDSNLTPNLFFFYLKQLTIEQRHGRVFPGWNEGQIYFPPTYKYSNNSDKYAGENMRNKEKRRTPAW